MPRGLRPLRHNGFRLLVSGQLASNFGDACYAVALPWYVLAVHGGPLLLGTVLVAYGVPRTVLLAFGGAASDRWRPWTVMMVSDIIRAVGAGALAVAAGLGPATAAVLVPVAIVLGVGAGMFLPGSFAIAPTLLPDDDLQAGNSLTYGGTQLATLVGPAVGGAVVALFGPAPAFWVDAATFVVSAATLAGIRSGRSVQQAAEPADQPRWLSLLREPVLLIILLTTMAANLGTGGAFQVALPALAHGPLRTGAGGFGALIAAEAAGALIGTLVAGAARRSARPAIVGSAAFLGSAVAMAVVPYTGGAVTAGVALSVSGLLSGFGNIVMITAFQRWAPPGVLGRVTGLLMLCSVGLFPVSTAAAALVVQHFGPAPFFPVAGAFLAAAVVVALGQRRWRQLGLVSKASPSSGNARGYGSRSGQGGLLKQDLGTTATEPVVTSAPRPLPAD